MSTWYRVSHHAIEPVEVEAETTSRVKVGGRLRNKRSEYDNYFPTRAAALEHILQRAAGRVGEAEFRLKLARDDEAAVKAKYADEVAE